MRITIDHALCSEPEYCGICLKVCAPQVFAIHPEKDDMPYPEKWVVDPIWTSFCIQCYECVEHCPQHAISIK
ncbi:MAG: 4Fe-4S dicluster domain-containing protein [Theionarchaea archaeon]|nr:4Fe-4S dicluster domain-containing protein [Theionarchaea archaeon]MBU7022153.1 4Fe-4S dicluster domain-containing protein [Theionarchaea archaeon]MBU7040178.1 4Fe-4S dicluster domain-containing protein [Theionarchaea archaeon]